MEKNQLIILSAIIGLAIISVLAVSLTSNESKLVGGVIDPIPLTEEQRYAQLNAEFACDLMDSQNGEDALQSMQNIEVLAEKYDFTAEEFPTLKSKYETSNTFQQLVLSEMEKLCPESAAKLKAGM